MAANAGYGCLAPIVALRGRGVWVVASLASVQALIYQPGNIGYDPAYALVWGRELLQLQRPDFLAHIAPTPHPLSNLVGALASLAGTHAYTLLLALSFVSFAALGYAAFVAGTRSFGAIAGGACAAILLTRPLLVAETLQGSLDIPFLAFVLGALAVELGERRRPRAVLGLLVLAGLLRPEAWLLSAGYVVWRWRVEPRGAGLRLAPMVALAPVLWLIMDLAITGDPLYSLQRTQNLAIHFERPLGVGSAISQVPGYLAIVLGSAVVWCSLPACVAATWFLYERARLPAVIFLAGMASFLVIGLEGLPLLTRYLIVPAAISALFAGASLSGWRLLPAGSLPRRLAAVGAAAAAIVMVSSIPATHSNLSQVLAAASSRRVLQDDLRTVANKANAGGWLKRCGGIQIPTYRVSPMLSYWLGVRPSQIRVVHPNLSRGGLLVTSPVTTLANDDGFIPGNVLPPESLKLPPGFHILVSTRSWTLAERC